MGDSKMKRQVETESETQIPAEDVNMSYIMSNRKNRRLFFFSQASTRMSVVNKPGAVYSQSFLVTGVAPIDEILKKNLERIDQILRV